MASDELRKKWGTIFMGSKEATMEQLDAMQEPVLREKVRKDQEQEYLERVRKRAEDRAREILGAAYTERQNIVQEAQKEAEALLSQTRDDVDVLKKDAQKLHADAEAELAKARALNKEAERIRNAAHDEGFKQGMDQAANELREFRADMGNEFANLLLACEGEMNAITQFWREDLAELMRVAVSTATGWTLEREHEAILTNLVLEAVSLLERREIITLRVNPEDEPLVSDMFRAAREKAPELKQWIVQGDEGIERGGIVAESGNGSVDLRRENYTKLVTEILQHLTLPVQEAEKEAQAEIKNHVEEVAHTLKMKAQQDLSTARQAPAPKQPAQPQQSTPQAAGTQEKPAAPRSGQETGPERIQNTPQEPITLLAPSLKDGKVKQAQNMPEPVPAAKDVQEPQAPKEPKTLAVDLEEKNALLANVESAKEDEPLPPTPKEEEAEPTKNEATLLETAEEGEASLQALEEELFPLEQDAESNVLAHGGFLPEKAQDA